MKKAEHAVGDYVLIPHGDVRKRPGLIIRRYKARYDTIGWHWRYTVRYLKNDLSEPRAKINADLRAASFEPIDKMLVLEMLARLPAARDQGASGGGSRRR